MQYLRLCLLAAIVWVGISPAWAAEVVALNPSADAAMYSENGGLGDGGGEFIFVGKTGTPAFRRSAIKFDLSGIPAGSEITGATLKITVGQAQGTSNTVSLYPLTEDWLEGTTNAAGNEGGGAAAAVGDTTWTSRNYNTVAWTTAGGTYNNTISTSTLVSLSGTYTFATSANMVAMLQGWLDTPATNLGWLMIGDEASVGASSKQINSRTGTTPPVLTVTYLLASYSPVLLVDATAQLNALVGDTINYSITVGGNGPGTDGSDASNVMVTGDISGAAAYVSGDTNTNNVLESTETWTYSGAYVVQATDGAIVSNTFTVDFEDERGDPHSQQKIAQTSIDHLALHYVSGATIDATQGDDVHLEMSASGGHPANYSYQWRFDDGVHAPVLLGGDDPFLDMNAVELADGGTYTCTVDDLFENEVIGFTVIVHPRVPVAGTVGLGALVLVIGVMFALRQSDVAE